jgi:hypothetical protein
MMLVHELRPKLVKIVGALTDNDELFAVSPCFRKLRRQLLVVLIASAIMLDVRLTRLADSFA